MASIDAEVVRHVARLARLRLEAGQEEQLLAQTQRIVEYVDVLRALPDPPEDSLDDRPPSPLRDDVVEPPSGAGPLLAGAPDRDGDHLRVPAVLEEP